MPTLDETQFKTSIEGTVGYLYKEDWSIKYLRRDIHLYAYAGQTDIHVGRYNTRTKQGFIYSMPRLISAADLK